MKKFVGIFLVCTLVCCLVLSCEAEATATACKAEWSEEFLWEELSKHSPSDAITAGIMGYFMRESQLRSDAVAGWVERNCAKDVTDICTEFTDRIDAGLDDGSTKEEFIEMVNVHYGGFGLGQWSDINYLHDFYDVVRDNGESIGDAEIQCEFIFHSMKKNERLWNEITELDDPYRIGRRIGYLYDGTGTLGAETIASFAKIFYGRYAET